MKLTSYKKICHTKANKKNALEIILTSSKIQFKATRFFICLLCFLCNKWNDASQTRWFPAILQCYCASTWLPWTTINFFFPPIIICPEEPVELWISNALFHCLQKLVHSTQILHFFRYLTTLTKSLYRTIDIVGSM